MATISTELPPNSYTLDQWLRTSFYCRAEIVVGGSGSTGDDTPEPADSTRQQLEKEVVKHVSNTSLGQSGLLKAATPDAPILAPFQELRKLQVNFDGRGSVPPSEALIRIGEGFWAVLQELKVPVMPIIKAGPDGLIAFSWTQTYPDPHMEVSLYEDETSCFLCDWYIKKNGQVDASADRLPYPCVQLRQLVQRFFSN